MTEVTPNLPHCGSFCKYCFMKPLHSSGGIFSLGCSAENTKPPARAAQAVQAGGTSVRVYSTQLLFVVVDVDIARGVFVLPQQQGGGERHSEGGKHGKQSLENFHGQEPPWSILCGAQQVLHRISNSSIA